MAFLERKLSQSSPSKNGKTPKEKKGKTSENVFSTISQLTNDANSSLVGDGDLGKIPSLNDVKDLLNVSERTERVKKRSKAKRKRSKYRSSSESSDSETEDSTSDSSSSDNEDRKKRQKKRGKKSGFYTKPGNAKLKSNELFAHVALDDEIGGERGFETLSFNLLVAGELEIIDRDDISEKERSTRIKVLRSLAYKQEYLGREEILNQYANFIKKVEKGKFKWGSKSSIRSFEQQLLYCVSIEGRKDKGKGGGNSIKGRGEKWKIERSTVWILIGVVVPLMRHMTECYMARQFLNNIFVASAW